MKFTYINPVQSEDCHFSQIYMRKEILFAIVGGILFGLIAAFGIWRANSSLSKSVNSDPTPQIASPTPTPKTEVGVSILKLEENDVLTETPFKLSGATEPNSWLSISGEIEDYVIQSTTSGAFEQDVELLEGINQLLITSYKNDGTFSQKKLTIIYSPEFLQEEGSVEDKVEQKIENATNRPRAYMGSITDIAESTLQIKNADGQIQQVSINENETTFVNVGKTKKEIKFSDIAIGDFIVAEGFVNGNSVLSASRVLLTSAPTETKRKSVMGRVTSLAKGKKSVKQERSEQEYEVEPSNKILVTEGESFDEVKFADVEEGDLIILVGSEVEETFEARRIHIIESSEEPSPTPEEE